MNYQWDWQVYLQDTGAGQTYLQWMMSAWSWTIAVAVLAWVVALVFGSLIGVLRTTPNRWLSGFAAGYVEVFRNIPLLAQLFIWYFVLPELLPASGGLWLKQLPNAPVYTAVVCLGF
jgi:glutamate/aspartate transport system permease protein